MIFVTKTFFPPQEEFQRLVQRIWDKQWITNNGALYQELILKLKAYLEVHHVIPMANGTLPLQIALNAYGEEGEVITTPFSYVATTAAIVWGNCTPVFVDIHPKYLTIDETQIEAAITKRTTAILATHVYGNPCNVEVIEAIALKHGLKVVYDAAHCFGVTYKGQSIFNYGDVSTCSFHATKLFHTGEGGALFCQDSVTWEKMYYRHNFGHDGPETYHGCGINAKMSELQAAMGLSVLPYVDEIIAGRKLVCSWYDHYLDEEIVQKLSLRPGTEWNYAYYPIIFKTESEMLEVKAKLEASQVYPRRYFYPSLSKLPYVKSTETGVADDIAGRVLCLPLYHGLDEGKVMKIVGAIMGL